MCSKFFSLVSLSFFWSYIFNFSVWVKDGFYVCCQNKKMLLQIVKLWTSSPSHSNCLKIKVLFLNLVWAVEYKREVDWMKRVFKLMLSYIACLLCTSSIKMITALFTNQNLLEISRCGHIRHKTFSITLNVLVEINGR